MSASKIFNNGVIDPKKLKKFYKKYKHDAFGKYKLNIPKHGKEFVRFVFTPEFVAMLEVDSLRVVPESLITTTYREYYTDILYEIPLKDSNQKLMIFVLIELKTNSYKWTVLQVLHYIVMIWMHELKKFKSSSKDKDSASQPGEKLEKLTMIIPIIMHYGEKQFTAPLHMIELVNVPEGMEKYVPDFSLMLLDLADPKQLEKSEGSNLEVFFKTLITAFENNKERCLDRIKEIYNILEPTMDTERSQEEWEDALYYWLISAHQLTYDDFLTLKEKGDIIMSALLEQVVIEEYKRKIVKERAEGIEQGRAEGIEEGRAEGIEEGLEKGRAEGIILTILSVLQKRFGSVPKKLQDRLFTETNFNRLKILTDNVAICSSIEEFSNLLKQLRK
jgi:hypothetical protein